MEKDAAQASTQGEEAWDAADASAREKQQQRAERWAGETYLATEADISEEVDSAREAENPEEKEAAAAIEAEIEVNTCVFVRCCPLNSLSMFFGVYRIVFHITFLSWFTSYFSIWSRETIIFFRFCFTCFVRQSRLLPVRRCDVFVSFAPTSSGPVLSSSLPVLVQFRVMLPIGRNALNLPYTTSSLLFL